MTQQTIYKTFWNHRKYEAPKRWHFKSFYILFNSKIRTEMPMTELYLTYVHRNFVSV